MTRPAPFDGPEWEGWKPFPPSSNNPFGVGRAYRLCGGAEGYLVAKAISGLVELSVNGAVLCDVANPDHILALANAIAAANGGWADDGPQPCAWLTPDQVVSPGWYWAERNGWTFVVNVVALSTRELRIDRERATSPLTDYTRFQPIPGPSWEREA